MPPLVELDRLSVEVPSDNLTDSYSSKPGNVCPEFDNVADAGAAEFSIHQQLVFRPTPRLGRAETPIRGLYLASASAHPGGGVHGACGANAARAALAADRRARFVRALRGR